jgi:hypothetical protein
MKRILSFVVLVLLLGGCNQELRISEVDIKNVNSEMRDMIETLENGNYLLSTGKEQYVFLNRINVIQGDEAVVLSDFKTEVKDNILTISFSEVNTSDYSNKNLQHQMLYKIRGEGDYDSILYRSNGELIPIDSVIIMD